MQVLTVFLDWLEPHLTYGAVFWIVTTVIATLILYIFVMLYMRGPAITSFMQWLCNYYSGNEYGKENVEAIVGKMESIGASISTDMGNGDSYEMQKLITDNLIVIVNNNKLLSDIIDHNTKHELTSKRTHERIEELSNESIALVKGLSEKMNEIAIHESYKRDGDKEQSRKTDHILRLMETANAQLMTIANNISMLNNYLSRLP